MVRRPVFDISTFSTTISEIDVNVLDLENLLASN